MACDYSCAVYDNLYDYLRDVPWGDVFKLSASAAVSGFFGSVLVEIDVYIPDRKYQVKPHLSSWFLNCLCCCHRSCFSFVPTE